MEAWVEDTMLHMSAISKLLVFSIKQYRLGKRRNWLYWSDSRVWKVDESEALDAEAYILFYRKIDNQE